MAQPLRAPFEPHRFLEETDPSTFLGYLTELTWYRGVMLKRTYEGQNCSIAHALDVVGERWTLLIIRDALLGLHRFDEFHRSRGIAGKVRDERLRWLADEGILVPARYPAPPARYE